MQQDNKKPFRKQIEQELVERERRFRTLAENSPDNIARYDLNCRTIYVNPALEKTLGRPASEILGTPPMEMKEADIYEARKYQEKIVEVLKTGKEAEMDTILPDRGGGVRYHNIRFVAERGDDGTITGVQTIGRDITERKQAEEALRASEARFRTFVDHAADAFLLHDDEQGTILDVNRQACESLGYSREELIGMTAYDFDPGLRRSAVEKNRARLDAGEVLAFETWHRRKDGSMFPVEVRVRPFWQGERRLAVSLARDITERKQAEDELKNVHNQLERLLVFNEALLSAVPTPVFYKDKEGRYLGCNRAFSEFTGVSSDQIKGKTVMELWPSENAEVYHKKDLDLMRNPERQIYEFRVRDKGGVDRPVIFAKNVFRDERKQVAGIVGAFLDISERKQTEEALRESEEKFRSFVESSSEGFTLVDEQGTIIEWNPAREKMTGLKADLVIGRFLWDVLHQMMPPERRTSENYENNKKIILEALEFGQSPIFNRMIDAEVMREDGERQFVQQTIFPIKTDKGYRIGSVTSDITERKRAQDELRASETRFRIFVDHAADAFFLHDERGNILDVNQQACKSLGYSREELIRMSPLDFDAGADRDRPITDQVESRLDIGETVAFETLHRRKDGSLFPVDVRARPFWQGERRFSVSLARDISERKQAEQALRESEERLRQIASSLREVIWLRDAQTRQVLYVNPAFEELTGRTCKSFYENRDIVIDAIYPDDKEGVIKALDQRSEDIPFDEEHRIVRLDGNVRWVSSRIFPVRNEAGEVYRWASIMEDITERKQMGDALAAREREFRTLAENSPDNIARYDANCRTLYVNPALERTLGSPASEMLGTTPEEAAFIDEARQYQEKIAEVFKTGKDYEMDIVLPDKGEGVRYHNIRFVAERGADGAITGVQTIGRDFTERKQAEIERQSHLQFLESMDQINRDIQGTNDLEQMMSDVLDIVLSVFNCDRAFLMYPLDPDALSWYSPMERTRPEYPGVLAQKIDEVPMDEDVARTFRILLDADGPVKFGLGTSNALPVDVSERFDIKSFMSMALYPKRGKPWQFGIHQCSYERIWTQEDERLLQEIGRRLSDALSSLLAYRTLQESEERYRQLVDVSPDAIVVYSQGRIAFVNPAAVRLAGAKSTEDLVGRSVLEFIQPDYGENVNKAIEHILRTGESGLFVRENVLRVDGTKFDVEVAIVPYQFQGENHIQILARDITERKQHEREREAIITVSTALRQARTRTEILNVILDQLVDLFDTEGAILVLPDPKTEGCINEMGRGAIGERMVGLSIPSGEGVGNWVITNKKNYLNNRADQDPLFYRPDLLGDSHCLVAAPLIAQEQAIGALLVARQVDFIEQDLRLLTAITDIAANAVHRVTLHEQTEQQLHRLVALHQIDLAISTNFDLNMTLNVLLGNVKDELEVDAASILLLNTVTYTLDYVAGIGFRTRGIERSHVKLGKGCAGRAAQELRTISGVNIGEGGGIFVRSSLLASEEFISHYATPLVVKGQIKGVLEVFHRKTLEAEHAWLSYFETLATQAAIAIENTSLFENLQRSNTELTLAYDATIEGWSRALDLRDRETEGHTQRVTEMALELAEQMGMNDAEKLDLRRGALLHDIGKMGIPDEILLKPGPLSDDEWEIMRRHPVYAYQMLSPITYLKRALEIPYCHHEKWDGSGYPRGLKEEEIPLSARVFAVVDVFDALTSDRPYSKAWPSKKAYQYIEKQVGKYFDPQVVKIFLETR